MDKKVDPPEAHDRVISKVLVAYEEPRERVERELPIVETRRHGAEELGGEGEDGDVLHVGVVIEAVAREVVSVVGPLPPGDGDPGDAVAGEELSELVVRLVLHDDVMPRVVADVSALHPEETEQRGGDLVGDDGGASQNAVEHGGEQGGDEG